MRKEDHEYLKMIDIVHLFAAEGQPMDTDTYDECWEAGITDQEIHNIYNQHKEFNNG